MLPPVEKTPIVILQWTDKALTSNSDIIPLVIKCLEQQGNIIVLPNPATDVLLLTATQKSLEVCAEQIQLIKERKIHVVSSGGGGTSSSGGGGGIENEEIIMDHFQVRNRKEFSFPTNSELLSARKKKTQRHHGTNTTTRTNRDTDGIFTVHERSHLVWELLDQISVFDNLQLYDLLVEKKKKNQNPHPHPQYNNTTTNKTTTTTTTIKIRDDSGLIYLLQSHEWINLLSPLHIDDEKLKLQQLTFYPIYQMMPPIHDIEDYYGPSIAYYFAWMGCLGQWTFMLGIFGLSAYLFRKYRGDTIDEDEYTPFYGVLCFVWAILFIRYWDREEYRLAYQWGTLKVTNVIDNLSETTDYSSSYDNGTGHRRPEFRGYHRISPITGYPETYYSPRQRKIQYMISAIVTIGMLTIAFFLMILSLNMQGYIQPRQKYHPFYYPFLARLSEKGHWFDATSNWKCFIPVIIHAACIFTLNTIYRKVAKKLTDLENHRTQDSYDNSLILKRFLFEAFDCYIVLFYLAFYECNVEKLNMELIAVFNIDSFRRLATEIVIPMILQYQTTDEEYHPHDLHLDEYEQFDDYMEILIQFGYVTLFASAYPLASLMMSGAIWLEIRSDCYKLTHLCQKPIAERVPNIGMWKLLLHNMVWLSCLTNCLLFGFTSDQMFHYAPNMYFRDEHGFTHLVQDKGWIAIIIIFLCERILIYFGLALHVLIPALPEDLMIQMKRRQFLLSTMYKTSSKEKEG